MLVFFSLPTLLQWLILRY